MQWQERFKGQFDYTIEGVSLSGLWNAVPLPRTSTV